MLLSGNAIAICSLMHIWSLGSVSLSSPYTLLLINHISSLQLSHYTFSKQIREELLDDAVAEIIIKIVSNPQFASMMQEKINMKVDTSEIEKEIDNYQKELRKSYSTKFKLIEEIDDLDVDDKHYKRRKQDLDDRLYRMYDKIEELESLLIDAKAKKQTIEAEKLTGDNIYKVLIYFDKLYNVMNDVERRQLITSLISEIQIYKEKQPNGQWLKSITFKLPIIDEDLNMSLDNDEQVDTEQQDLEKQIQYFEDEIESYHQRKVDSDKFLKMIEKYTDIEERTVPMINEYIEKVVVHKSTGGRKGKDRKQQVDVYFNFIGNCQVPQKLDMEKRA